MKFKRQTKSQRPSTRFITPVTPLILRGVPSGIGRHEAEASHYITAPSPYLLPSRGRGFVTPLAPITLRGESAALRPFGVVPHEAKASHYILLHNSPSLSYPKRGNDWHIRGDCRQAGASLLMAALVCNRLFHSRPSNDEPLFLYHTFRAHY